MNMLATPFLTQLDSRAAIKGSRDPLGVMSIWSRLGREVIGNVTTISSSVRDFKVLLLGYYFAEQVARETGGGDELRSFLKWEQLAAYARAVVNRDRSFRGTERVLRRLNDGDRIRLSVDHSAQILGDQKTYGLWGLYSVPTRASGLLEGDPGRLTAAARDLVERVYLPVLTAAGLRDGAIVARLRVNEHTLDLRQGSKDMVVLEAVAKVLATLRAGEREVLRTHVLYGGPNDPTHGVQRALADLLATTLDDNDWALSPETVATLARRARERDEVGGRLADGLERIRHCELLVAPAVAVFEYALSCDGQPLSQVAAAVAQQWGTVPRSTIDVEAIRRLEPSLRAWAGDRDSGARWVRVADALHSARYDEALQILLAHNAAMMTARSAAAPWVVVRDGKLDVRFRDERLMELPQGSELPTYWQNPYFISSLRNIALELRG
jgi:hypothetical protein